MKILFFGIAKDIVGQRELTDYGTNASNVEELLNEIKKSYPRLHEINSLAVGVNQEYAESTTPIRENDVVALIPPVSGG